MGFSFDLMLRRAILSGIPISAAAGNGDMLISTTQLPCTAPGVLCVGSIDEWYNRAVGSNYGPRMEIVAPGQRVVAAAAHGYYTVASGTSLAAPHIAGILAIILGFERLHSSASQAMDRLFQNALRVASPGVNPIGS